MRLSKFSKNTSASVLHVKGRKVEPILITEVQTRRTEYKKSKERKQMKKTIERLQQQLKSVNSGQMRGPRKMTDGQMREPRKMTDGQSAEGPICYFFL